MIRSIHLTDTVALFLFAGKKPFNMAKSRDRLGQKESGLLWPKVFMEPLLPWGSRRHTLVSTGRVLIHALASARRRNGPSVWEIDRLLFTEGYDDICPDLLLKMGVTAGEHRVERVFLRLPTSSPLIEDARKVGFSPYVTESLYRLEERPEVASSTPILRPRSKGDEHGLFELYNTVVPAPVRNAEGMTLKEWRESREWRFKKEFVYEKEGSILGWLRIDVSGRVGHFEIMMHPREESRLEQVLEYGLALLNNKRPILCLTPEFQEPLHQLLARQKFVEVAQYCNLVKQLATRVQEPRLVPMQA